MRYQHVETVRHCLFMTALMQSRQSAAFQERQRIAAERPGAITCGRKEQAGTNANKQLRDAERHRLARCCYK